MGAVARPPTFEASTPYQHLDGNEVMAQGNGMNSWNSAREPKRTAWAERAGLARGLGGLRPSLHLIAMVKVASLRRSVLISSIKPYRQPRYSSECGVSFWHPINKALIAP